MNHVPRPHPTDSTTSGPDAPEAVAARCELCAAPIELDDKRRFYCGARPPESFLQTWTTIESRRGLGLVVEMEDEQGRTLVAEAGYAPLGDGEFELVITVDPGHCGWIGPWLLDSLVAHARGVRNIQARVLADNRAMSALADHRGFVVLDNPDFGEVRLTMSTGDNGPTWPEPKRRPRVVIESNRRRFRAETELRAAGFDVAICRGPSKKSGRCPVLDGIPCPLLAGADAAIVDLPLGDPAALDLLNVERVVHPGLRVLRGIEPRADGGFHPLSPAEILYELEDLQTSEKSDSTRSDGLENEGSP